MMNISEPPKRALLYVGGFDDPSPLLDEDARKEHDTFVYVDVGVPRRDEASQGSIVSSLMSRLAREGGGPCSGYALGGGEWMIPLPDRKRILYYFGARSEEELDRHPKIDVLGRVRALWVKNHVPSAKLLLPRMLPKLETVFASESCAKYIADSKDSSYIVVVLPDDLMYA
jgi:hypothetical protein